MRRGDVSLLGSLLVVHACSAPETTQSSAPAPSGGAPSSFFAPAPGGAGYDALIEEGSRHVRAGELDEARRAFEDARALASDRVEAAYGLGVVSGRLCWETGRACEDCVRWMDGVIERGGFRHSHYNRGECLLVLGKPEVALADLEVARTRSPDDVDVLEARGLALLLLGRREEGCRDLERAEALGREVDPAHNETCPSLGPVSACVSEPWGGWAGDPACAQTAARIVPGAHRACSKDAECVRVGTDCDPHAVNQSSVAAYGRIRLPCTNPAAGPCAPRTAVTCEAGCCVVAP